MPPKKTSKDPNASKKNQEKAKTKIVEDKTFGLKNKKGKKQQTYIKNVSSQVQNQQKKQESADGPKISKKEAERLKLEELNKLFKPVQQVQKVEEGVDPKSVLCNFFKQNLCQKGHKCKFSHDLSLERKTEKRNMYEMAEEKETMDDWDQAQLEDVVNKKHGASNDAKPKTDIICKYFLDAVEKSQYGWFWTCPSGDKCIYKHALPKGFVLKKDKKLLEAADEANKISLEELIEKERAALSGDLTPVTMETFLLWKKKKIQEKKDSLEKEMTKKKEDVKTGSNNTASGKELFLFKPELADADDEDATNDFDQFCRRNTTQEDETPVVEISLEELAKSAASTSVDAPKLTTASLSVKDRDMTAPTSKTAPGQLNGCSTDTDINGLPEASGGGAESSSVVVDGIPVDESLFEDLDDLDIDDDELAEDID